MKHTIDLAIQRFVLQCFRLWFRAHRSWSALCCFEAGTGIVTSLEVLSIVPLKHLSRENRRSRFLTFRGIYPQWGSSYSQARARYAGLDFSLHFAAFSVADDFPSVTSFVWYLFVIKGMLPCDRTDVRCPLLMFVQTPPFASELWRIAYTSCDPTRFSRTK